MIEEVKDTVKFSVAIAIGIITTFIGIRFVGIKAALFLFISSMLALLITKNKVVAGNLLGVVAALVYLFV